jgi:hypothetical protein
VFHKFLSSVRKKFFGYVFNQFSGRIFTTDETWVHHHEPESKAQNMAWNAPHHPWLRNSKINHQPVRLCLHFFGVILVHFTLKSPDLAPSDFHMFGPMKEALIGRRFSSDEEVIGAV